MLKVEGAARKTLLGQPPLKLAVHFAPARGDARSHKGCRHPDWLRHAARAHQARLIGGTALTLRVVARREGTITASGSD